MGPKKGRRVRQITIPADTPTEFELGDMTADIQWMREARGREEEAQKQREEEMREETTSNSLKDFEL